jgi:hypothetical protein
MKLTLNKSKSLAKKYLANKKTLENEFLFSHAKSVVEVIEILSKILKLNKNEMSIRAWVQDIGHSVNNFKPHQENSIELLNKEGITLSKTDLDCILNHVRGGSPETIEGKAMQIADKLSILNIDFLKMILSNGKIEQNEMDFAKSMSKGSIKQLKELKKLLDKS